MNLRHWRYFLRIAEAGSLSRVADQTGVAQPALSRQIKGLEESLGATLFERNGRGVQLTPAGRLFAKRSEILLNQIDNLDKELAALEGEPAGRLAIGAPIAFGSMITTPLIESLLVNYPQLNLFLLEGTSTQVRDAVLSRRCEIGVLGMPIAEPSFHCTPFAREQLMLFGPCESGLKPDEPLTLKQVAEKPLIVTSRSNSLRVELEHALETEGLRPSIVLEVELAPIMELIANGTGYSALPACFGINTKSDDRISCAPIADLNVTWAFAKLRQEELSIGAQRARETIVEIGRARIESGEWKAKLLYDSD